MATLSSSITTYLNQWLKIASGGRVTIHQHVHGWAGSDYIVFRCETCKDNWHVGVGQFYSVADPVGVPSVLQDWVNKHRHVCTKWVDGYGLGAGETHAGKYKSKCGKCEWPYAAHQESWIASVDSKPEPEPENFSHPFHGPKSFWIGKEGHKATCSYVTTVATGTSTQNCDCGWVDYCSKNFQLVKDKVELELIALQAKVEMAKIKYYKHDTRPKVELIEENVGRRFRE